MELLTHLQLLKEGSDTEVYLREGNPVQVYKVLKTSPPDARALSRLHNEHHIAQRANIPEIRRVLGQQEVEERAALQLAFIPGKTWRELQAEGLWSMSTFFHLAKKAAESLAKIHGAGVLHLEISPDHMIYNDHSDEVAFIGWGGARLCDSSGRVEPSSVDFREKGLAYMSPEQTGRTDHSIHFAADLYALGAVFYEMVTGQPPFQLADWLELVHAHIAKTPIAPSTLQQSIPQETSGLLLKLLGKNPDARFESAAALAERLAQFDNPDAPPTKQPSQPFHASSYAKIPSGLFGREEEQTELKELYKEVIAGAVRFTLISGPSGTHKSALVDFLGKEVKRNSGLFIQGKFDRYQRDTPYLALVQGLKKWVAFLLTQDQRMLDYWKDRLLTALGNIGKVLTDIVPDLTYIIGKQPALPNLKSNEAQNRFLLAFRSFIGALADERHPLVLGIANLQWSDPDTIILLENLLGDSRISHFQVIGTFREDDGEQFPWLKARREGWSKHFRHFSVVKLGHLSPALIRSFIAHTFEGPIQEEEALLAKIVGKTKGNPLYLELLTKALIDHNILRYEVTKQSWSWQSSAIDELNLSGGVLDLMSERIRNLPPQVQYILSLASCMGLQFDQADLPVLTEQSERQVSKQLELAAAEGLIFFSAGKDTKQKHWHFAHDGIREIAYSLLSIEGKQKWHYEIGQLLCDRYHGTDRDAYLFDIVQHLNLGQAEQPTDAVRLQTLELNYAAGLKARNSGAFGMAYNYMQEGIRLVETKDWRSHYKLSLRLHNQAVDLAVLNGNYAEVDTLARPVEENAKDHLDTERICHAKIQAYVAQKRLPEAIEIGLAYLRPLGHKFPRNPNKFHVTTGIIDMQLRLRGANVDQLPQLPISNNREVLSAVRILNDTANPAYFAAPNLTPLIIFETLKLCLKHGMTPESAFAFGGYGFIYSGALRNYDSGFKFGEISNALLKEDDHENLLVIQKFIHNIFTRHWKESTRDIMKVMEWVYQKGLELGNFEYGAYAAHSWLYFAFYLGANLEHLEKETARYVESVSQLNQATTLQRIQMYQQAILNLQGKSDHPTRLVGQAYDADKMLEVHQKDDIPIALHNLFFLQAFLAFLFGEYERAVELAAETRKYADGATASYFVPLFDFLESLILLNAPQPKKHSRQVNKNLRRMKQYAKHGPMNYEHQYLLVQAEKARVKGQKAKARVLYEDAAFLCRKVGNLLDEALIWELGGRFYLEDQRPGPAAVYLKQGYHCFKVWGAAAKARQMETAYGHYITHGRHGLPKRDTSKLFSAEAVDFLSLVKTLQTLSTEIELPKLLEKMMGIVIENAGAERGLLILEEAGDWKIIAEKDVNSPQNHQSEGLHLRNPVPMDGEAPVPVGIIYFVIRTQETLVINDVRVDARFNELPYLQRRSAKSIMGIPLIKQNRLIGVIYLENTLIPGAFTPRIQEGLQMLSGQLAISLENALLYENLEAKVRERTQELAAEKEKSDQLLLNILPEEIAEELKQTNSARPRSYEMVSVIFTDFKNFTSLAERFTPGELVTELDHCFSNFDRIVKRNGLEKIKTIGDAYMCVSGIPGPDPRHAERAIRAGLEFQAFVKQWNADKLKRGLPEWKMRVGIHSGRIIAGVVGEDKFAFDIWGDTVNLAARMESSGEIDRVNVSETTYQFAQNLFNFEPRGKVTIKNKGEVEMYFVKAPTPD